MTDNHTTPTRLIFAGRLREEMETRELNISQVATMAGVNRETVSRILAGKLYPSEKVLEGICQGLDLPPWVMWLGSVNQWIEDQGLLKEEMVRVQEQINQMNEEMIKLHDRHLTIITRMGKMLAKALTRE